MDRLKAIAAKILANYKEHYDFPWQGESHMEDCIMDALQSLSLESVRSEARNAALEEAAKVCDECRVLILGDPTAKQGAVMIARETGCDLARQIRFPKVRPARMI